MGGDKIVLLDGAGANGGGAATNGLLSMIPGMFANLIGSSRIRTQVSSSSARSVSGDADPRGGSDGRAHWRNQDLYGPGIPECG